MYDYDRQFVFSTNPSPWRHARAAWTFACFLLELATAGWKEPEGNVTWKVNREDMNEYNYYTHMYKKI